MGWIPPLSAIIHGAGGRTAGARSSFTWSTTSPDMSRRESASGTPSPSPAPRDDASSSASAPKRCAGAQACSNWFSFVGNVLGASGKMTGWKYEVTGPGQVFGGAYVWALGWDDASPQPYDTGGAPTTVRDGTWDWLQAKQSWHNSPAATLPASLYMPGKPDFFGSNTWPWVDPTTGATLVLPAKARFDAGNPNG